MSTPKPAISESLDVKHDVHPIVIVQVNQCFNASVQSIDDDAICFISSMHRNIMSFQNI